MSRAIDISLLPAGPEQITLSQWIAFHREHGKVLDDQLREIEEKIEEGKRKQLALTSFYLERAYRLIAHFCTYSFKKLRGSMTIAVAQQLYEKHFAQIFTGAHDAREFNGWLLPEPTLDNDSTMTFGEFIDSKVLVQNAKEVEQSKWELIQYIACIFLRPAGEPYTDALVSEKGERLDHMGQISLDVALCVASFFEQFNSFLHETFTIFKESGVIRASEQPYMTKHFEVWGWVNFIKQIAKAKVFDTPGLNSIESARAARCFDVLVYASEEKNYSEAMVADMEHNRRNK